MAITRPRVTQLNTDVTKFNDPIIEINAGATPNVDVGIILNRGVAGDNAGIIWDQSEGSFALVTTTADGDSSGDLVVALTDLQVNSVSTAGFTFPSVDGTIDQIISTNGNQVLSWIDAPGGLFNEDADGNIVGGSGTGGSLVGASALDNFLAGVSSAPLLTTGDYNLVIGNNSADALDTASRNILIGGLVGTSLVSGSSNTLVGYGAGNNLSAIAAECTGIGVSALGNQIGSSLVAVGNNALSGVNTNVGTMTHTVAVGKQAGFYTEGASGCVFVGSSAGSGRGNTLKNIGDDNTYLGKWAGYSNFTGGHNVAVGHSAMYGTVTRIEGDYNVAVGADALINIEGTFSNYNTVLGAGAGNSITTGASNVLIGRLAGPDTDQSNQLYINNSQSDTPLIHGNFSLSTVTVNGTLSVTSAVTGLSFNGVALDATGAATNFLNEAGNYVATGGAFTLDATNRSIYAGTGAGANLSISGFDNFIAGQNAAAAMNDGDNNTIIGLNAGLRMTTAKDCVAIGQNALSWDVWDHNNIAIGSNALLNCSNPNNVAIGASAGQAITSGTQNLAVGYIAGNGITTGDNNTAIGTNTADKVGAGSNNICLGINAGPTVGITPSNKLFIAITETDTPLIGGDFSANTVSIEGTLTVSGALTATGGVDALKTSSGIITVTSTTPTAGQVLTATTPTVAEWQDTATGNLVDDLNPQLGAHLDMNGFAILNAAGKNSEIYAGASAGASSGIASLNAGDGATFNVAGGSVNLIAGIGGSGGVGDGSDNGKGGTAKLASGPAGSGSNREGGTVVLQVGIGDGTGVDGYVELITSNSAVGTDSASLHFREKNGNEYIGLKSPNAVTTSVTWTLPQDTHVNAAGKFLTSDASGVLSFAAVVSSPGGADTQIQYNNGGAFGGASQWIFDDTTNIGQLVGTTNISLAGGIEVTNTGTNIGIGVHGISTGTNGQGVRGETTASTGVNYGIYGRCNSPDGYAGYFKGDGQAYNVGLAGSTGGLADYLINADVNGDVRFTVNSSGLAATGSTVLNNTPPTANNHLARKDYVDVTAQDTAMIMSVVFGI